MQTVWVRVQTTARVLHAVTVGSQTAWGPLQPPRVTRQTATVGLQPGVVSSQTSFVNGPFAGSFFRCDDPDAGRSDESVGLVRFGP